MPPISELTTAIRKSLAEAVARPPPAPTAEQLADDARDALGCVEAVMEAIVELARPPNAKERGYLGLILLRASCDHARAMLFLLANNPLDMAASALALHRAQIESFLRAVFFARIATDEEVEDFLANDQGPRRLTPKNKWAKIAVADLAVEVQEHMAEVEGAAPGTGKLGNMVANAWDPLCGMVHGGRAVHAMYVDGENQIGCAVPAPVQFQATTNAVSIVNFSLATVCVLSGWDGQEDNPALTAPMTRFHEFIERHNARLRAVGLRDMQRHIGQREADERPPP